jgi:hypothetical protein
MARTANEGKHVIYYVRVMQIKFYRARCTETFIDKWLIAELSASDAINALNFIM